MIELERICNACGETKPIETFRVIEPKRVYYSRSCVKCRSKARSEYNKRRWASGESKAYQCEWNKCNPGKAVEYSMKWKAKNPDAYRDYMRENPWAQRIYNARRRAQKAQVTVAPFGSRELLAAWRLAGIDANECLYCSAVSTGIDHIVPFALGGGHLVENCVPACGGCNSSKHDHPLELWIEISRRKIRPDALDRIYAYREAVLSCV